MRNLLITINPYQEFSWPLDYIKNYVRKPACSILFKCRTRLKFSNVILKVKQANVKNLMWIIKLYFVKSLVKYNGLVDLSSKHVLTNQFSNKHSHWHERAILLFVVKDQTTISWLQNAVKYSDNIK